MNTTTNDITTTGNNITTSPATTTPTTGTAGRTPSTQDQARERREQSFHDECPSAGAYIARARRGKPLRPAQHGLVMRWPKFDCMDQLHAEFWEFGTWTTMPGLLLHGESGTGKTTSAYMAIEASLDHWHPMGRGVPAVMAWRAADLGRTISELSRGSGEDLRDLLDRLGRTGLLFIDDLDKARFTPRVESELFDLLECRETDAMPVLVTTNLKGRELEKMFSKHIGPAIVNRLRRMCIPIDFDPVTFNEAAALAAIQTKIREDCATEAEANRAFHMGETE
jgi:hypothetical protein